MVVFLFRDGTHLVRKFQGLRKVLEFEYPLQALFPLHFLHLPMGNMKPQIIDLGIGERWLTFSTGNTFSRCQIFHTITSISSRKNKSRPSRGTGQENYTAFFEERVPKSLAGARNLLAERIFEEIQSRDLHGERPATITLKKELDVDIAPDMKRFGDKPQNWIERDVKIGSFELKAENIQIKWNEKGEASFQFDMYVEEQTGIGKGEKYSTMVTRLIFTKRHVRMGEWKGIQVVPKIPAAPPVKEPAGPPPAPVPKPSTLPQTKMPTQPDIMIPWR
jgi:hypothetical protein